VIPIEAFRETLCKAMRLFRSLDIPFHLTGGITSVVYGEPRMTQDVDMVVCPRAIARRLPEFLAALAQSDFLHNSDAVRSAVIAREMFQLLDLVEALKLDIYPREMIPGELRRSSAIEVFEGVHVPIASRIDAAASKLIWISKGSHKSRRDLRHVFRRATADEQQQIRQLAIQFELESLLDAVLAEPDEISSRGVSEV
jgi:hypothetical protein